ncbi:chorismate lyase [Ferrimonas sediminicola]|uniref:Probable chorismate pyruvate-lyase n=1 Tax=Ferrimonas sediminicola TaxID=2569538 RepID=A0A4U1B9X9_9GAMM|nr:chorismate lyase [Ferrimonas sediminicola]TKB47602.1 chorismate lyase [Ferrimonas sediminicola]
MTATTLEALNQADVHPVIDLTLPPGKLLPWLQDKGSLTLKLKALCRRFEVEPLQEGVGPALQPGPGWDLGQSLWQRVVLLKLDGVPWVYAITEVPGSTLASSTIDFPNLGNQPLGERLFASGSLVRGPLQVCRYGGRSSASLQAKKLGYPVADGLWGRQREFELEGQSLRVSEVFLPPAYQTLLLSA